MGSGQPGGEAGYNVGRVAAILAGLPDVPGVTVNRYCSSSLQTIRMAAHAIRAGEGDVFIAAGVETVSRYRNGAADTGPHNPLFADAEARTAERTAGGRGSVDPAGGGLARHLHRHGPDRRERGRVQGRVPTGAGRVRRPVPAPGGGRPGGRASSIGRSSRSPRPNGTVVTKDDGPRPGTTLEGLAGLKPVFREGGTITAGNACPLNDGAAAVIVMSDTKARELGITPAGPDRGQRGDRAQPRDHGPRAGRGHPPGAGPGRHDHRRHRPGGDQRGLRRPGRALRQASWASATTSSTSRAAPSPSAIPSVRPVPAS